MELKAPKTHNPQSLKENYDKLDLTCEQCPPKIEIENSDAWALYGRMTIRFNISFYERINFV